MYLTIHCAHLTFGNMLDLCNAVHNRHNLRKVSGLVEGDMDMDTEDTDIPLAVGEVNTESIFSCIGFIP